MKVLSRTVSVNLCRLDELTGWQLALIESAVDVRSRAQAPYSHYRVGAALLSRKNAFYVGCNVERATYTQSSHAEQAAVDAMVAAEGAGAKIKAVAVVGGPAAEAFILPNVPSVSASVAWGDICPACGHCLQIILENCRGDEDVLLLQPFRNGIIAMTTIGDALPMAFGPKTLGVDVSRP